MKNNSRRGYPMEHIEEQPKAVGPTRPRMRVKRAHRITLLVLALGIFLMPFWWWLVIVVGVVIVHLLLTIGHWYEISELLWEENLDLALDLDVAQKRVERLEEENVRLRRQTMRTVAVPLVRGSEIPQQRRGDS